MKILVDAAASFFYHSTGIGAYATELTRSLQEIAGDHELFLFTGEAIRKVDAETLPTPKTVDSFWQRMAKQRSQLDGSFDLYHNLHNGIGMKTAGKKQLLTIHDMIPCLLPQYCGSPYKELFLEEIKTNAERADAIVTVSENSKADIASCTGVDPAKIQVIAEAPKRNCKPLNQKMAADYLLSRYQLRQPFLLYVGGFNERKNVAGLIKAYAGVYRDFPEVCPLVIVGREGNRRRKLEDLAESLAITPFLRFPGYVPDHDLPFFYNQCKALVYPSFYEGFGLPPLEAAACRTAVIVSDRSSLKEVMAEGGLYANPEDIGGLGEVIRRVTVDEDLRKTMAAKAYDRAQAFSYEETARQTLELYEKICR